jgi:hypothetical protein
LCRHSGPVISLASAIPYVLHYSFFPLNIASVSLMLGQEHRRNGPFCLNVDEGHVFCGIDLSVVVVVVVIIIIIIIIVIVIIMLIRLTTCSIQGILTLTSYTHTHTHTQSFPLCRFLRFSTYGLVGRLYNTKLIHISLFINCLI